MLFSARSKCSFAGIYQILFSAVGDGTSIMDWEEHKLWTFFAIWSLINQLDSRTPPPSEFYDIVANMILHQMNLTEIQQFLEKYNCNLSVVPPNFGEPIRLS